MAAVNVTSVSVLNNPAHFSSELQFEISYECLYRLEGGASSSIGVLQEGCLVV